MKKKLILELLVVDRAPQVGDLVLHPEYGLAVVVTPGEKVATLAFRDDQLMTDRFQVVEPYGLSGDPIEVGDYFFANQKMRQCVRKRFGQYPYQDLDGTWQHNSWKKVDMKPEQFDNMQLVKEDIMHGQVFIAEEQWELSEAGKHEKGMLSDANSPYPIEVPEHWKKYTGKITVKKPTPDDYNYQMLPMNPNPALPNWMRKENELYTEQEVKALLEKLVNDFPLHRGMQLANELPAWFEKNKKQ